MQIGVAGVPTPSMYCHTFTLSDGRQLGYALYGVEGGTPLFFFHGWPGSRLRAKVYDELAKRLNIRLIAPDRPGIGLSDPKPKRTILDWPIDVKQLADYLQVDRFAVLGISGGGVYAAACGYTLGEHITRVGIAATPAPLDAPHILEGLLPVYKLGWQGYARFPQVAYVSSLIHSSSARYFLRHFARPTAARQINSFMKSMELSCLQPSRNVFDKASALRLMMS